MKLAWLAALGLLVSSAPALAQRAPAPAPATQGAFDPERLALARELIQVLDLKSTMHNMLGVTANSMGLPASATPDQRARVKQLVASLGVGFDAATPDLMDAVAKIYAKTFTAQEMRDALTFYRSPSGRAMLAKQPAATHDVATVMRGLTPKILTAAKVDYCRHRTCDKTDRVMFAALDQAYGKPAS